MQDKKVSLIEIAKVFLTIGTIGFGGGLAIIAMMRDYCVERKKWLSSEEFSHGVAMGQFLGPFAVNTAIFAGYRAGGLSGSLVALISFLTPSVIFVMILTELYLRFNKVPALQPALDGVGPVVIVLILIAAFQMGKGKLRGVEPMLLLFGTIILFFLKVQVVFILLLALVYAFFNAKLTEGKDRDEDS